MISSLEFVTILYNVTPYTIWTVRNIQVHKRGTVNLQNFSRLLTKERFSIKEFRYSYKYKHLYAFSQSWTRNDVLRSLSGKHLVHLLKLSLPDRFLSNEYSNWCPKFLSAFEQLGPELSLGTYELFVKVYD